MKQPLSLAEEAGTDMFLFSWPRKDVEPLMAFVRVSCDGNRMSR